MRLVSDIPSTLHVYPGCEHDVTLCIGLDGLPRLCGSCERVNKAISKVEGEQWPFIPVEQLFGAVTELSFDYWRKIAWVLKNSISQNWSKRLCASRSSSSKH